MHTNQYVYSFRYDDETESDLCKLESRSLFNQEEKNKQLFSDIRTKPSSSAFIKRRLEIVVSAKEYAVLIDEIKGENICIDGFKVEYLELDGDPTLYPEQLEKLKEVGFCINTFPDYYNPTITYGICFSEGVWYFGILIKNSDAWLKHKKKPRTFSNSISNHIAKALVNVAAKTNKEIKLLDACCGVGTIMLEACFAGYHIDGCDINWKICRGARENLAHFNYTAEVYLKDISDHNKQYDAAIIDLPYNLYSRATERDIIHIIESTAKLSDRMVIVSTSDITKIIRNAGFEILDYCIVKKRGKSKFSRKIWVCKRAPVPT